MIINQDYFINKLKNFKMSKIPVLNHQNSLQSTLLESSNILNEDLKNNEIITNIISQISNSANLNQLVDKISSEIAKKLTDGQFITSSNTSLIGREPLSFYNIATTDEELQSMLQSKISMEDIFNTWYQFVHKGESQNAEWLQAQKKWSYNAETDSIMSNVNTESYIGFISPDSYKNFYLKIKCTSNDNDNDMASLICGFYKDTNGIEHTLSICRSYGTNVFNPKWQLIYDYTGQTKTSRQYVLFSDDTYQGDDPGVKDQSFVMFEVRKEGNTLTCKTGVNDSEILDETTTCIFTLPDTKPDDWPNEMWDIMNIMFSSTRIGFGNTSWNTSFKIVDQNILSSNMIYDWVHNDVYEFKNNAWSKTGTFDKNTFTMNYSLIYSSINKKLFYYRNGDVTYLEV